VGSRKPWTSSTSTFRPAKTRASNSSRPWRCAIVSARADPRSSRRSRHARPVKDCSTPRKQRSPGVNCVAGSAIAVSHYAGPDAPPRIGCQKSHIVTKAARAYQPCINGQFRQAHSRTLASISRGKIYRIAGAQLSPYAQCPSLSASPQYRSR
jgi:hypothetical protein